MKEQFFSEPLIDYILFIVVIVCGIIGYSFMLDSNNPSFWIILTRALSVISLIALICRQFVRKE